MRAVETRTRLEQLQSLRSRTQHQIRIAHAHGDRIELDRLRQLEDRLNAAIVAEGGRATNVALSSGRPRTRRKKAEEKVLKHLERLGVSSHDVKVWAVEAGLIPAVVRGRIKGALVDAYEAAHAELSTEAS